MSTLAEMLGEYTALPGDAADHLQLVVAEWQLLADLSFADLLLWVPVEPAPRGTAAGAAAGSREFLCVAQARPTTGPTAHQDDVVGMRLTADQHPQLARALDEERIVGEGGPQSPPGRREAVPVSSTGRAIAVLSRESALADSRVPSSLEVAYLDSAADLCQMIADGSFPSRDTTTAAHVSPRVGDGFLRLDASGTVDFASPNALSAYHRMGHEADLAGVALAPLTRSLLADPLDAAEIAQRITGALAGRPESRAEAESRPGAVVLFRAIPLRPAGVAAGALVLVRDVTEVTRRDRALLSKDATIREIHHRVKNNLQTVATLLRLQSRRTTSIQAHQALEDSVRRVSSIAMVHESLSASADERVDLDRLLDKVLPALGEIASTGSPLSLTRDGVFGIVLAEIATPLVMVLAELVQNAAEHAFPGEANGAVLLRVRRSPGWLDVTVSDDGQGVPAGSSAGEASGLGLQIVRTLVESELRGSLSLQAKEAGGMQASLCIPLRRRD